MTTLIKTTTALASTALVAVAFAAPAAAEKWDMPLAYSASNFHSENAAVFAACVTEGTGGDIEIVTHPGGSLFGGADIKRAIQTGQVQIGERLKVAHVLSGSVRRMGDQVRVTAQLVDARAGYQVWSETYDRTLEDILGEAYRSPRGER